jgi:hypothetical protein
MSESEEETLLLSRATLNDFEIIQHENAVSEPDAGRQAEENDEESDDEVLRQAIALSVSLSMAEEPKSVSDAQPPVEVSLPQPEAEMVEEVEEEGWADANGGEESWAAEDVWSEANAADIHPDELDYDEDQEVDVERERLLETLGEELHQAEDEDSDSDDDEKGIAERATGLEEASSVESLLELVRGWSWDMPTARRWEAVGLALRYVGGAIAKLRVQSEAHLDEARQQRAQAAGQSFKKAHLIGATVVGATRRLEALRSAEPFAMVRLSYYRT